ncbi:MAG: hypothetical protein R6U32_07810 [Candidatus Woesearchaeota archaeon]
MKKARKYRMCTWLSLALAVILFTGGSYIIVSIFLETRQIDFTWASNILIGIAGILVIAANICYHMAKENESLFD